LGLRALLFILTIFIIFSGCVEENNVTQSNESAYQGPVNITPENLSSTALSSKEENIPEIKVSSFSSIFVTIQPTKTCPLMLILMKTLKTINNL
jgi:hypothetical protein